MIYYRIVVPEVTFHRLRAIEREGWGLLRDVQPMHTPKFLYSSLVLNNHTVNEASTYLHPQR